MWAKIVGWVQLAYGDIQTMESNSYSRATTPEQIIGAAVVTSMGKNIEDWVLCHKNYRNTYDISPIKMLDQPTDVYINYHNSKIYFLNKSKNILCEMQAMCGLGRFGTMRVNDIPVSHAIRDQIIRVYKSHKSKIEAIERDATERLRKMQQQEKAWDMAERLLGMKRNEQGALVPIEQPKAIEDKSVDDILVEIEEKKVKNVQHHHSATGGKNVHSR